MKKCANHPSTVKIESYIFDIGLLSFPEASRDDIIAIKKSLKPAIGPDLIPMKITKTTANVIEAHLTSIINVDLKANKCSKMLDLPIYEKKDCDEIKKPKWFLNDS